MKKLLLSFVFALPLIGKAQQAPQASFYTVNALQYNPAYAGARGTINANIANRAQWVGLNGAPRTQFLSVQAPIEGKNFGIGLAMMNDKTGVRSNSTAMLSLAYQLKFKSSPWKISLGLTGGLCNNRADFSSVAATDLEDPKLLQGYNLNHFNYGAGIYAFSQKAFVSMSVPLLSEPQFGARINPYVDANDKENPYAYLQRSYYMSAGLVFFQKEHLDLKSTILFKYTSHAPIVIDLNVAALINKKVWIGALYRYNAGLGMNFTYSPNNRWNLGYAIEFPINQLYYRNKGSHELFLSFDFQRKNKSTSAYRYF